MDFFPKNFHWPKKKKPFLFSLSFLGNKKKKAFNRPFFFRKKKFSFVKFFNYFSWAKKIFKFSWKHLKGAFFHYIGQVFAIVKKGGKNYFDLGYFLFCAPLFTQKPCFFFFFNEFFFFLQKKQVFFLGFLGYIQILKWIKLLTEAPNLFSCMVIREEKKKHGIQIYLAFFLIFICFNIKFLAI